MQSDGTVWYYDIMPWNLLSRDLHLLSPIIVLFNIFVGMGHIVIKFIFFIHIASQYLYYFFKQPFLSLQNIDM